jgi:hypothetical protein
MFVKQATTDRLLGMLVTLATAGALYFIQVCLLACLHALLGLGGWCEAASRAGPCTHPSHRE